MVHCTHARGGVFLVLTTVLALASVPCAAKDTHRPTFKRGSLEGRDTYRGKWELTFVKKKTLESGRKLNFHEKVLSAQAEDGSLQAEAKGVEAKHVWAGASMDGKEVTLGGHGPVHMEEGYDYAAALLFDPPKSDRYILQGTLHIVDAKQQKIRIQIGMIDRKGIYEQLATKDLEPGEYDLEKLFEFEKGIRIFSRSKLVISSYRAGYHWYHTSTFRHLRLVRD